MSDKSDVVITIEEPSPIEIASRKLSIVVPAYNEELRLGSSLKRMLGYFDSQSYSFEILVVDDGSNDSTASIAAGIAANRAEVKVIMYQPNRGKGHAVRYGILKSEGDLILFCDADLATPIEEIEKLISSITSANQVAIGSRDVVGSELVKRQSVLREFGGRFFNKLVQLIAVPGIHDTQCGFKLFSREAALKIFNRCQVDHFAFDVEALFLAKRLGYGICEVPVRWAHQEGSKVRFFRDAIRMIKTLFKIRMTHYDLSPDSDQLNPK